MSLPVQPADAHQHAPPVIGAAICLIGVAIIMYAPRTGGARCNQFGGSSRVSAADRRA